MAKLSRIYAKIFGSSSGSNQIAKFGSLFAGSPAFTTDAAEAQSLANYLEGWFSAAIGGNSPAIEDMNAVFFAITYQLAYYQQSGIPEWDATTPYYVGSLANDGLGGIYVSRTDNNVNNILSNATNWKKVGGEVMTALGDMIYGDVNGAQARLAGNVSAVKQFLTQTGTGTTSVAPVWSSLATPLVQSFTSNGTYTPTAGCLYAVARVVGAGGGGSGSGSSGGGNGGNGTATTVGSIISAGGGFGGTFNNAVGSGGTGSISSPAIGKVFNGSAGQGGNILSSSGGNCGGGPGGDTPFGGSGGSYGVNLIQPVANSGSGGCGGGGSGVNQISGNGGGAGCYIEAVIPNPTGTYAISIGSSGSGGSGGAGGNGGAQGATGYVEITEYFQ